MKKSDKWFEIKVFKKINPELKNQILEFKKNNVGIRSRKRTKEEKNIHTDKYSSKSDLKRWVIAFDKEFVIGLIKIYKRNIKVDDKLLSLGGIGGVRVAINKRKMGIAGEMMTVAMKELSELNCDVALLGTNLDSFLANWYKKYGFVLLSKKYKYLGNSGKEYLGEDGMIAPIKSTKIFNELQNNNDILNIGKGNW